MYVQYMYVCTYVCMRFRPFVLWSLLMHFTSLACMMMLSLIAALMLSGYNRNTSVVQNEFAWLGGNAVVAWGITNDSTVEVHIHLNSRICKGKQ